MMFGTLTLQSNLILTSGMQLSVVQESKFHHLNLEKSNIVNQYCGEPYIL